MDRQAIFVNIVFWRRMESACSLVFILGYNNLKNEIWKEKLILCLTSLGEFYAPGLRITGTFISGPDSSFDYMYPKSASFLNSNRASSTARFQLFCHLYKTRPCNYVLNSWNKEQIRCLIFKYFLSNPAIFYSSLPSEKRRKHKVHPQKERIYISPTSAACHWVCLEREGWLLSATVIAHRVFALVFALSLQNFTPRSACEPSVDVPLCFLLLPGAASASLLSPWSMCWLSGVLRQLVQCLIFVKDLIFSFAAQIMMYKFPQALFKSVNLSSSSCANGSLCVLADDVKHHPQIAIAVFLP